MADHQLLRARLQELAERTWDVPAIEARCKGLTIRGIAPRSIDGNKVLSEREAILTRVQRRAEEYNYYAGNCARSSALAVMEEFGLGRLEVLRALSPFPGCGGTGWMCGGVTGGLAALGLHFGSDDLLNGEAAAASMKAGRQFMLRFEDEIGALTCRQIQEFVFGRFMDPGANPENMVAFAEAKGFQKCSLFAGAGARIAAEIIINSLE